jgi:hypothetical protein
MPKHTLSFVRLSFFLKEFNSSDFDRKFSFSYFFLRASSPTGYLSFWVAFTERRRAFRLLPITAREDGKKNLVQKILVQNFTS